MGKTSDLNTTPLAQPIPVDTYAGIETGDINGVSPVWTNKFMCDAVIASANEGSVTINVVVASSEPGNYTSLQINHYSGTSSEGQDPLIESYTHNGKTVYYSSINASFLSPLVGFIGNVVNPEYALNSGNRAEVAWTMIYGDPEPEDVDIPVQWVSQCGLLETSFKITVD